MLFRFKEIFIIFLCFSLNGCKHLNFLHPCSEYGTDKIGDHQINCNKKGF